MENKLTGNEPINPQQKWLQEPGNSYNDYHLTSVGGLTIRQHYAGLAMQGILSNDPHIIINGGGEKRKVDRTEVAKLSVEMADELIAELNKPKGQ